MLLESRVTQAADCYSLAMTLLEVFTSLMASESRTADLQAKADALRAEIETLLGPDGSRDARVDDAIEDNLIAVLPFTGRSAPPSRRLPRSGCERMAR